MRFIRCAAPCFAVLALLASCTKTNDTCLGGSTLCGSTCVSLAEDQKNCGVCGKACDANQVCSAGVCTATQACLTGSQQCGATCVDIKSDQDNCGACGTACTAQQRCVTGACTDVPLCATGSQICGATCVNLQSDQANCGACGTACTAQQRCVTGSCADVPLCAAGSQICGATCVDIFTDQRNCGVCGNDCGSGSYCDGTGHCKPAACTGTQQLCDSGCTDVQSDPANCGLCGAACPAGLGCFMGACVELAPQWEVLSSLPTDGNPAFNDYVPAGETAVYNATGSTFWRFDPPGADAGPYGGADDAGNADAGTFTPLSAPPDGLGGYVGLARVGGTLYSMNGTNIYAYDIASDQWTTPVTNLEVSLNSAETTTDESGFVYALSAGDAGTSGGGARVHPFDVGSPTPGSTTQLVQYNSVDGGVLYFTTPPNLTTSEPRVAWDTLSARLYLADYNDGNGALASFDPVTGTFATLANFPDRSGVSDAFCSDRKGHIFTANSDCNTTTAVWVYTASADHWEPLYPPPPFAHGCNASCTVSDDGYLYLGTGDGNVYFFGRLKIPPLPTPPPASED